MARRQRALQARSRSDKEEAGRSPLRTWQPPIPVLRANWPGRALVKNFFCFLIFAGLSLLLGLGSAHLLINDGFALILSRAGPWKAWINAGTLSVDPYTRAHIARTGLLPITSASGLTYFADTDSDGRRLSSYCDYEIIARPVAALWWTVAVFDEDGKLIPNKAARHAFSS